MKRTNKEICKRVNLEYGIDNTKVLTLIVCNNEMDLDITDIHQDIIIPIVDLLEKKR